MCFTCETVINMIESAGIFYQYYNIEQMSTSDVQRLILQVGKEHRHVPIIIVNGRAIGDLNELRQYIDSTRSTPAIVDSR